jgi:hypothetical protein
MHMPKLVISGIAQVFNDPRASEPAVNNNKAFAFLNGMYSYEMCSEYFDELPLSEIGIGGGRLRFVLAHDEATLRISTAYDIPRELTEDELAQLLEVTLAQWSDGIGSGGFRNHHGQVLSTALALALHNTDSSQTNLGEFFVDAYPFVEDRDVRVEFYQVDTAEDEIVHDLLLGAKSENPQALVELGRRYEEGNAVEQNDTIAYEMYVRAAARSHPAGMTFLGQSLLYGRGAVEDKSQAVAWFRKGAEAGFSLAMHYLGECYVEGYGVKADLEEAVHWYRLGADLGDPGCLAELGDCLEFGRGIEKNLNEALRCYRQALAYGLDAVQEAITRIELGSKQRQ